MGLLLLLQPVEEVADQLFRRILGELFFVKTKRLRQLLRTFQPLFEQRLGDVGQFDIGDILKRCPLEMVGEDLIVGVEVPFALDEDSAGRRVEVVHGTDQAEGECLLKTEKGGRGDRDPLFPEHVEKSCKHGIPSIHSPLCWLIR